MSKLLNANSLEIFMENQIKMMIHNNYKGRKPSLVIIVASDDKASQIYVNNKIKMGNKLGRDVDVITVYEQATNDTVISLIEILNNNKAVDGIILQLPIYNHLCSELLINTIDPDKDVDGLTMYSKAMLECNKLEMMPCTPLGVKNLLTIEGVFIPGKNVVIVGKGETAGAPMATMFRNMDATVTICNARTSRDDLEWYIRHADIVVSCVGKQNLLDAEWFKEGSVVVGVGLSYDENGKQQLDFNVDKVLERGKVKFVSQRTNCTGKATVISLMYNTVWAYCKR